MRNIIIRTVKTFVAAFISSVATIVPAMSFAGYDRWQTAVMAVIVPSISAGITAVMNLPFVKKFFKDYGEIVEREDI